MSFEDSDSESESESWLEVSEDDANTSYSSENDVDPDYKAYVRQLIAEGDACEFQILNDDGEFEQEPEHQLRIERTLQKVSRIKTTLAADENINSEKVNKGNVSSGEKKESRKSLKRNIKVKDNVIEVEDSRNAEKGPKSKARNIKEGDGEDENYNFYLKYLYEGSESCFEDDANSESSLEGDIDPQYKEYLKNLRATGNSYEFEIPTSNAEVEPEIERHRNIDRNSQRSSRTKKKCDKNLEKENIETVKTGVEDDLRSSRRNAQTKINVEELEELRNDEKCPKQEVETKNKRLEPQKLRGKHVDSAKRSKGESNLDDNDIVMDTYYQEFLDNKHIEGDSQNLRATENSYKFKIPTSNAKIEPEIKSHRNIERNSQRSSRIKKKCDKNLEKVNKETVKTGVKDDLRSSRRNAQTKINVEELEDLRNDEKCPKQKVKTKNKRLDPKELRGKHVDSAMHSKGESDLDNNDIVTDTCYQEFLDNKHIEGDCMVYRYNNYKRLKYEEEDDVDGSESSSDIEIIKKETIVQSGKTPQLYVSPIEGDDLQWIPNLVKDSMFRENLIEKLKRPYDQEEYDYLWNELNEEKPRTLEKNTRFGVRKVVKGGFSKSYLERYHDLKAQISAVQFERPKMLNILRGFFHWLENSSHDGAFIPWKDPSCLAMLPGTR